MSFQSIPKVEDAQFFLDVAFRAGKDSAARARSVARGTRLEKSREIELARVVAVKKGIERKLDGILKSFPSFDQLTEFYRELLKCYIDILEARQSLGAVAWAKKQVERLFLPVLRKIKRANDLQVVGTYRRSFYGRAASVLKQINKNLKCLEKVRFVMREFPIIKSDYFTVAITGFPNVGKTTLLFKLSGSMPEIREYAFTTKSLNLGYLEKVQLIDTPGTLNRFEKMNNIEKQAYLAIKHCADLVVYVFDVTEPYPLADQKKLLQHLQKFGKPIVHYVSKTDIISDEQQGELKKEYPLLLLGELKEELLKRAKEELCRRAEEKIDAENTTQDQQV